MRLAPEDVVSYERFHFPDRALFFVLMDVWQSIFAL
jgi:hypothetical protein